MAVNKCSMLCFDLGSLNKSLHYKNILALYTTLALSEKQITFKTILIFINSDTYFKTRISNKFHVMLSLP